MKRSAVVFLLALAVLAAGAAVISAAASDEAIGRRLPDSERVAERWTPERLLAARPMPPPRADLERLRRDDGDEGGAIAVRAGVARIVHDWAPRPPSARVPEGLAKILIDPAMLAGHRPARERHSGWTTSARGNFLLDFTSSRLVPEDSRFFYPYSTSGKLFFSIPGEGDFICSGAVVSARVVATAGHCVNGGGSDFFEDFLFVPAYWEGEAPFGAWTANFVSTTVEWSDLPDVPNEADFGFLVVNDIGGTKIGSVTGWLGWLTGNLSPNHVHILGYPGNLNRGERMHQVTAGASIPIAPLAASSANDTHIFGSDMLGGSSGGPWIQNFGVKAKGQRGSKNAKLNRIVGITSYASSIAKDKVQGSSDPGASFKAAFNLACSDASGNCSKKGKPKS